MYFFVVLSCIHSHQIFILKMFKPTEKLKNSVIYTHVPFMWIHQLTFVTLLSLFLLYVNMSLQLNYRRHTMSSLNTLACISLE